MNVIGNSAASETPVMNMATFTRHEALAQLCIVGSTTEL